MDIIGAGESKTVLSPEELAKRWGISYWTIKRQLANRDIPSFKVGKKYRIPMDWILSQESVDDNPTPN